MLNFLGSLSILQIFFITNRISSNFIDYLQYFVKYALLYQTSFL